MLKFNSDAKHIDFWTNYLTLHGSFRYQHVQAIIDALFVFLQHIRSKHSKDTDFQNQEFDVLFQKYLNWNLMVYNDGKYEKTETVHIIPIPNDKQFKLN